MGYDNINKETLVIDINKNKAIKPENKIRKALSKFGFMKSLTAHLYQEYTKNSVKIDNPFIILVNF